MGSIRAGSVMENMWLVFEFGGNYKSAQIFSTASCGPPGIRDIVLCIFLI